MSSWEEVNYYAGFDWANDHHDVIILDRAGRIVADFQIEHTQQGWQRWRWRWRWREQVAALGPGVAACVETSQGIVVEKLLESGSRSDKQSPTGAPIRLTMKQRPSQPLLSVVHFLSGMEEEDMR
jgi:hypothetical protein